jgi:hypothetical protein
LTCAAFAVLSKDAVNVHDLQKTKTLKIYLDFAQSNKNMLQLITFVIFIRVDKMLAKELFATVTVNASKLNEILDSYKQEIDAGKWTYETLLEELKGRMSEFTDIKFS